MITSLSTDEFAFVLQLMSDKNYVVLIVFILLFILTFVLFTMTLFHIGVVHVVGNTVKSIMFSPVNDFVITVDAI